MTETRVARDGDRQQAWPWIMDSSNSSKLFRLYFIIINFFYHIASSEIYVIISITVKEFYISRHLRKHLEYI